MEDIELNKERQDLLAQLVIDRYRDAAANRAGVEVYEGCSIDTWFDEALDRYTKRSMANRKFNLTRVKVGALHAKVKDMIINSVDAPFVIEPTPIPQLSKEQQAKVVANLEDLLGQKLIEAGIVVVDEEGTTWPDYDRVMVPGEYTMVPSVKEWLKEQAIIQKRTMENASNKIAREAVKHATTVMLDQMYEGGWREAYLDSLFDTFLYGTGVLRIEKRRIQSLKWTGDELSPATEDILTWRHVPVYNCYPSSDSESAQIGTYFIERGAMRKQDLFAATQVDWVDEDRVKEAYENARENYDWLNNDSGDNLHWSDDALIDVLIHEGTVRGDKLLDYFGEENVKGIDADKFYDAEVWVLAGVCIGVKLLDHPNGMRSYFSAQMQRVGRRFWGIGAAMTLHSIEDRLNSWLQDLDDNLELSIAPPIFYNATVFNDATDITLRKRAAIPFNSELGLDVGQPFHQVRLDSKSNEILSLFNWAYRLADDESGIPGFLSGNDQLHGGESTFRGMKMLAASSNMLIKDAFLNIDQSIIQPVMEYLWRWNMLYSDDAAIKADAKITARGAAGLMQKEVADAERTDVLPILLQLIQAAGLDEQTTANVMNYLLRQTMEQGGIPVNELLVDNMATAEQTGAVQSLQPATPLPTIGSDQNTGGLNVS